jgi:prepilin-type N-terminal cleavage/methylation domain-containing protein/prepilin-type processing-associated H-X9-DG protein
MQPIPANPARARGNHPGSWAGCSAGRGEGFTLVELLVVIAIIGVLVALLLPALSAARASALASGAANHLSAFGKGFELHAQTDEKGRYTTGAFDHLLDGDIRERGWVADLIRLKVAVPGKARDGANAWQVSETVADYTGAARIGTAVVLDGSDHGWTTTAYAAVSGNAYFGSVREMNNIWNSGYNATFATTWHFCRGDPSVTNDATYPGYGSVRGSRIEGDGPLDVGTLGRMATTASRVALMGPARASDGPAFIVRPAAGRLRVGVADGIVNGFVGFNLVRPNDLLLDSFTDGMNVLFEDPAIGGNPGRKIHELSDIHPLHQPKRGGRGGFAPVLFADGHVERVFDCVSAADPADRHGDSFIGNSVTVAANGTINGFVIDGPSYHEAADQIWLKRLRAVPVPGTDAHVD